METKNKGKKRVTTFDELIESRHGKIGTKKRTDFEIKAKSFAIGEIIKEERRLANMTQDELADKTGTKKWPTLRILKKIVIRMRGEKRKWPTFIDNRGCFIPIQGAW